MALTERAFTIPEIMLVAGTKGCAWRWHRLADLGSAQ